MPIKTISDYSDGYPAALKEIAAPPKQLYIHGADFDPKAAHVAIVGTRKPTAYGMKMAFEIASEVGERGGVVVSGLAFGIDAICHRAAVSLGKPTIAVLASGINYVTPRLHVPLAEKIVAKGGTIVSEFMADEPPLKYRYLRRNRIISGLCRATVVIEAGDVSGALITARHAFTQNRDVYAVAGDIDRPQGEGCRKLIREDIASPVFSIEELMKELGLDRKDGDLISPDINASSIFQILRAETRYSNGSAKKTGLSPDSLVALSGLKAEEVLKALSFLEIAGMAKRNSRGLWLSVN